MPFPRISSYAGTVPDRHRFDPANPTAQFVRDKSHNYLSPHVQVSFPVTDRTNFRLSYSHQVQAPDFGAAARRHQHRPQHHQHQPGLRHRPRLRQDHHLRVRHPARVQRRHGAGRGGVQQGHRLRSGRAAWSRCYDPVAQADNDFRILTNLDFGNVRGLDVRLDRRFGNYFNGTLSLLLPAGQEHRLRSVHLHQLRVAHRESGGRQQRRPASAAGDPADRQQPAAHRWPARSRSAFPVTGRRARRWARCSGNVSVFSTFRYTSGTAYSKCGESAQDESRALDRELQRGSSPRASTRQRLPAFKQLTPGSPRASASGGLDLTALSRRPEPAQLQERPGRSSRSTATSGTTPSARRNLQRRSRRSRLRAGYRTVRVGA